MALYAYVVLALGSQNVTLFHLFRTRLVCSQGQTSTCTHVILPSKVLLYNDQDTLHWYLTLMMLHRQQA